MKKSSLALVVFALAVLVAGGVLVTQKILDTNKKDDKKPEVPIGFAAHELTRATMAQLPVTVSFSGPLVAPQTAVVRAKGSGTLLTLSVAEGQRVKAGQSLGRIDTSDLDNRLAERRAMLESARAQVAQAERTHASNEQLSTQNFISPNALESSRVALEAARAQWRAAQAQLGSTQATARFADLVAPIEGIVAKRHVVAGEKLSPEQQVLTIVDLKRLEVAGSVGTHEVSLLKVGMPLKVEVEGVAKPVAGVLERIAPAAEAGTRSIAVAVTVVNVDEALRAGQYATASATLPSSGARLTLPYTALSNQGGQEYVWTIENGALVRRAVTLGLRDAVSGRVEVLHGVTGDATVLALKFDNLREGQKVVVGAGAAAPQAGGAADVQAAGAASSAPK